MGPDRKIYSCKKREPFPLHNGLPLWLEFSNNQHSRKRTEKLQNPCIFKNRYWGAIDEISRNIK